MKRTSFMLAAIALLVGIPASAQPEKPASQPPDAPAPPAPPSGTAVAVPPVPPVPPVQAIPSTPPDSPVAPVPPVPPVPPMPETIREDMIDEGTDTEAIDLDDDAPEEDVRVDVEVDHDTPKEALSSKNFRMRIIDTNLANGTRRIVVRSMGRVNGIHLDSIISRMPQNGEVSQQLKKLAEDLRQSDAGDVRAEVERTMKEVRRKKGELAKVRIMMTSDSLGLSKMLEEARRSIDSAGASIEQIDSLLSLNDGREMNVYVEKMNPAMRRSGRNVVINMVGTSAQPNGKGECHVLVSTDSEHVALQLGSHGSNCVVRKRVANKGMADTAGNADREIVMVRIVSSDSSSHVISDDVTDAALNGTGIVMLNNHLIVGRDSIPLHDDGKAQMVIRTLIDSLPGGRKTNVVIVTRSRTAPRHDAAEQPEMMKLGSNSPSSPDATAGYELGSNVPNPFSGSTTISFTLPTEQHATVNVFDAAGKNVRTLVDETLPAGSHTVVFDARDLPNGMYLYRMVAGRFSETKTMTLAK
ncbi:MAG TPA: T9SS type A sorting domain-containing protein [Candidatus Kapabacteria bacterium]|nr:T9SS type A sorting domain-containing protein [Candidatus Kapabacteria bacterium]